MFSADFKLASQKEAIFSEKEEKKRQVQVHEKLPNVYIRIDLLNFVTDQEDVRSVLSKMSRTVLNAGS